MKTAREILLERHRAAQPKLDAVRRAALAMTEKDQPKSPPLSLLEFLRSLRWHAAGMGAAWLLIMFLRMDASGAPRMMAAIPPEKIPTRQVVIASLRENRRQLSEMIEPAAPAAKPPELFLPRPRSERRGEMLVA